MILDRLNKVSAEVEIALKSWKDTNHHVLIVFLTEWCKQEVQHVLGPVWEKEELLHQLSLLLYLFVKRDLSNVLFWRWSLYWVPSVWIQISCSSGVLEKKWDYSGAVRQLFIHFKKACDKGELYCTTFSLNLVYLLNMFKGIL
jgi:hypothetical protein